jgi:hypothetical protein
MQGTSDSNAALRLQVRAHATSASGWANEDGAGAAGRFAWIVDGASGTGGRKLTPGATDASWLAAEIDSILRECIAADGAIGLNPLVRELATRLRERFEAVSTSLDLADPEAPCACLAIVRVEPGAGPDLLVRGAVIGDVAVLVPTGPDIVRWTDERLKPFETLTLDVLKRQPRFSGHVPDPVLDQIRRNRRWLNRSNGYFAVHPCLPWTDEILSFEARIDRDRQLVLATDGFLRLSDLFGEHDDASLHRSVLEGETQALLSTLRRLERTDPLCQEHLRVKMHDDATVMAVAPAQ